MTFPRQAGHAASVAGSVAGSEAAALLAVSGVRLAYGGVTSLDGVSFRLAPGTLAALIGPNGAGKTSMVNVISGVCRPDAGTVVLRSPDGRRHELTGRGPTRVSRLGVARTFQNIRLFGGLSALDNVRVGLDNRPRGRGGAGGLGDLAAGLARTPAFRRRERAADERAAALLALVGLAGREGASAAALSYGERRRLEIARALGTDPRLLLVDEPAAGANHAEKQALVALLRRINATGVAILLIEHDMTMVAALATTVVVLNFGRVIATGTPAEIRASQCVQDAYLGGPVEPGAELERPAGAGGVARSAGPAEAGGGA